MSSKSGLGRAFCQTVLDQFGVPVESVMIRGGVRKINSSRFVGAAIGSFEEVAHRRQIAPGLVPLSVESVITFIDSTQHSRISVVDNHLGRYAARTTIDCHPESPRLSPGDVHIKNSRARRCGCRALPSRPGNSDDGRLRRPPGHAQS